MRRICFSIVLALALAALAAAPASSLSGPQVLNLLEVEGPETPLDPGSGADPPRVGARFAFTSTLYRWAGRTRGAQIGRVEGICTYTSVDVRAFVAKLYCTAGWFLPSGKILAAGFLRFAEDAPPFFAVAITGGTGSYANVRGSIRISPVGGEDSGKANHRLQLLP
jgi:hypothetical protein